MTADQSIVGKSLATTFYANEFKPRHRVFITRYSGGTGPYFIIINIEQVVEEPPRRFRTPKQIWQWKAEPLYITTETYEEAQAIVAQIEEDYDAWMMTAIL